MLGVTRSCRKQRKRREVEKAEADQRTDVVEVGRKLVGEGKGVAELRRCVEGWLEVGEIAKKDGCRRCVFGQERGQQE